ncbi:MAG: M56 and MltD domain-containing protein [Pseudomonadota bacterium]
MIAAVNAYVGMSVALLFASALLAGSRAVNARLQVSFAQRHLLFTGYVLCAAALLAPLLMANLRQSFAMLPPVVQVWSGASMHAIAAPAPGAAVMTPAAPDSARLSVIVLLFAALLAGGAVWMLARLAGELRRAIRLLAGADLLRSRGGARVLVSSEVDVPLSFWLPGLSVVLLPVAWLTRPDDLRIALRHEAQHHRHLDTRVLYVLQVLRAVFWWNPGAHWLVRQLLEQQEFACDEAVVGHRSIGPEEYCRCLLRTAEESLRSPPLTAAGIRSSSRSTLLRRIDEALRPVATRRSPRAAAIFAVSALALLGAIASATATPIHDRRISLAEAQRLAAIAQRGSTFPIVVNPQVLRELNALLGTPDGRAFLRASRERMAIHGPYIETELARHGLPRELLAVPLAESGYRNRVAGIGGGLWMFIAPTARHFGLHVSETRDERLDVVLETDAAMRMLSGLKDRYGDWLLALIAYNAGESHVDQMIEDVGSTDAFALIGNRAEDAIYLPRVMAVILVLASPDLIE